MQDLQEYCPDDRDNTWGDILDFLEGMVIGEVKARASTIEERDLDFFVPFLLGMVKDALDESWACYSFYAHGPGH